MSYCNQLSFNLASFLSLSYLNIKKFVYFASLNKMFITKITIRNDKCHFSSSSTDSTECYLTGSIICLNIRLINLVNRSLKFYFFIINFVSQKYISSYSTARKAFLIKRDNQNMNHSSIKCQSYPEKVRWFSF